MQNVKALLVGGPSALPAEERVRHTPSLTEKIKHRFEAGYEHFVHHGEFKVIDGEELAVFHWTTRTAIAE
ncbi:DUF5988 family protein [Streptomyces sp. NBC_01275]|uniref:DUF5988 family protein n=1 Tax=Streptomyces sp. NBC_01275 TaxID=2903807 RepID=UPI00225A5FD3|nr:DUF5988 family protein [Streptomyces sp. NBC_01275]MCX4761548.1 DUF5988 family protein [Streptomyces sp. NBC_01275]